jgi:hypothetical protein
MNTLTNPLFLTLLVFGCVESFPCDGQGTFQNLNFESADLPVIPPGQSGGEVSTFLALPYWSVYVGNDQQFQVLYNYVYNSTATVDILGPNWEGLYANIIDGQYSVFLQSGIAMPNGSGGLVDASIAQIGMVPANAESLQFKAWESDAGTFTVSFAGNNLSLVLLSTGQSPDGQQYDVYGADIAPYAGQIGQLEFTQNYNISDPSLLLDDITFSPDAVPEPSIAALTAIGGLLFGTRKWFARR